MKRSDDFVFALADEIGGGEKRPAFEHREDPRIGCSIHFSPVWEPVEAKRP